MVRDILYLFHHLLGKCLRQPIGPYNGQDIRARVIDMTDDLRNTSLRLMLLTAKIRNLHNHLVAGHCPHIAALGNENVLCQLLVVRYDKTKILILLVISHHLLIGMFQDPDDSALCPSSARTHAGAAARHPAVRFHHDLHPVPMKGCTGLVLGYEHILLHPLHGHKAKAFGMPGEYAVDGKCLSLSVFPFFGNTNPSLCHQGIKDLHQVLPL